MLLKGKDIAKKLGVSTTAVSLAINHKPGISEAKRRQIIRAIQEMGCDYLLKEEPSDSRSIGFVVYKRQGTIVDESPFFSYFLEGITAKLDNLQYSLKMLYISSNMSTEEQNKILENAHCAGLIIFAVEMIYEDLRIFKDSGLPFVILDNSFQFNDVDTVAINNANGMRTAVNYLISRGHRRIGYIRSKSSINGFVDRFNAYRRTLQDNGIPFHEEDVVWVGYSDLEARQDMTQYVRSSKELPTAFVSDNDLVACGAMKGAQEAGLSVPEDISFIGFDDRPISLMMTPTLTTLMVPKDAFGNACVDLITQKIDNPRGYAIKVDIGTILIERESVRSILP